MTPLAAIRPQAPLAQGTLAVQAELDQARASGPLRTIVIPPCPELLIQLRAAQAQTEPDLQQIARIASSDVAMSAVLLKTANSAAYSNGQPANTIGQAMNRLGLVQSAAQLSGYLVQKAIRVDSPQLQRFWQRAAKRAIAMSYIACQLPGMSPDVAHTYGLFCHVGMPVMMQSLRGYRSTMVEADARIDRSYVATENANHRTDHAVVGALVARLWHLAPEAMVAIRRHHDLDMLGDSATAPEAHTLVAAGLVAEHLMRCHEGLEPDVDWLAHRHIAMDWLQIGDGELIAWEDALTSSLDEA